jgi:hypothetical protein
LLILYGFWFGAGDYMAKIEKIDKYIPGREIYAEKNAGQNWQLMLPLLYNNKCLTIKKNLYNILERKDSHSRGQHTTLEQISQKYLSIENTLIYTINHIVGMSIVEKERYKQDIIIKYKKIMLYYYIKYRRFKEARKILDEFDISSKKMLFKYYYAHIPFADLFQRIAIKLLQTIKMEKDRQ